MSRWKNIKKHIEEKDNSSEKRLRMPSKSSNRWDLIKNLNQENNTSTTRKTARGPYGFLEIPKENAQTTKSSQDQARAPGETTDIFSSARTRNTSTQANTQRRNLAAQSRHGPQNPDNLPNDIPDNIYGQLRNASPEYVRNFLTFRRIGEISAYIFVGLVLATASFGLIKLLSGPHGGLISMLGFIGIFFWMKKKGWLPL